jgi:hypothetical protein
MLLKSGLWLFFFGKLLTFPSLSPEPLATFFMSAEWKLSSWRTRPIAQALHRVLRPEVFLPF